MLQPHPVLRRADRRRVEPTAPRMRRLSPPAGCGGCSVRGKPRRCLQDSVNRGTRLRHHPRPRTTARSRFSSRSGSEWTVGAAPARSRCPPGPPWPGLARGRARMDPSEIPGIDIRKQGVFCPNEPHPGLPRCLETSRHSRVNRAKLIKTKNMTVSRLSSRACSHRAFGHVATEQSGM